MQPVPLTRKQGDTWAWQIGWYQPIPGSNPPRPDYTNPINLTGWTAKVQLKRAYADTVPALALTSPSGGLTVDGPNGAVSVLASFALTDIVPGRYLWECEVTNGTARETIAEGPFIVTAQVIG